MVRFSLLALIQLVYLLYVTQADVFDQPNVRNYEFNITLNSINPDCSDHTSPVFLINKQMPGPPIIANQGDKVRVLIRNQLESVQGYYHDVSIHFHGIRQYGSNQADGVPYLTQIPIKPGDSYFHEFRVVNQAGTFFYHAHVGFQEETVFGPIIVYESQAANPEILAATNEVVRNYAPAPTNAITGLVAGPFFYDDERTILLSEWWHRPPIEFENWLMGPNFTFIPEASSILINGKTLFDPRRAVVAQCGGYETVPILPNKTYRIRVIGATAFRTLDFAIAKHNLTIIEVDGELVKPYTVDQLEVAPGQRFSVLLHTNQHPDDYAIQVVRRWSDNVPRETNGIAILQYPELTTSNKLEQTESESGSRGIVRFKNPVILEAPKIRPKFKPAESETPYWIWSKIEPLYGVDPIVRKPASRTIMLRSVDKRLPDGRLRWQVNGIAYQEMMDSKQPAVLDDIVNHRRELPGQYNTADTNGYDPNLRTYPLKYFEIVDIVIQTTHMPGEPCRSHPWHTHGHSHWEIANGKGEYVDEHDGNIRNVENPISKDVTMIYPNEDTSLFTKNGTQVTTPVGCGWSKIRIVAVS
jgi:FtsP/CotA-like multicopper oxidase with cupredoxin domain